MSTCHSQLVGIEETSMIYHKHPGECHNVHIIREHRDICLVYKWHDFQSNKKFQCPKFIIKNWCNCKGAFLNHYIQCDVRFAMYDTILTTINHWQTLLTYRCHIFPWLCAWDVCYIIFYHLLHQHSGKTRISFSLLLNSLWWAQIVRYLLACRSYLFMCTVHHLIIIIVQIYLKTYIYIFFLISYCCYCRCKAYVHLSLCLHILICRLIHM